MFAEWIAGLSEAVWGVPTVAVLIAGGLWLSFSSGFVQLRHFGLALRLSAGRMLQKSEGSGTSPFEAVCTALAGTIGTGNIAGVMIALTLGGPGAVFWMWISAFVGMGTKYAEILLAVRYREKHGGETVGGPMYTIKNGLGRGCGWLAVMFCLFGAAASLGVGNMMQMGSILTVTKIVGLPQAAVGLGMGLLVWLTVRRGTKGRGRTAAFLVPVMAMLYITGAMAVILVNLNRLPEALGRIFTEAFSVRPALGGAAGFGFARAMSWGFRRGMFSNEAGLGSSPIAHASAETDSPVEQGFMGIFEVLADTLVMCTLTALMVLCSGVPVVYGTAGGAEYSALALASVFGDGFSSLFMAASMALFAFSSIVGWSLYGERCVEFLLGGRGVGAYRLLFSAVTVLSAFVGFEAVIRLSDILNAMMLLPNMAALLLLSPEVRRLTRAYFGEKS